MARMAQNSESYERRLEVGRLTIQFLFSSVVLGFCIYQLFNGGLKKDGSNDSLYWGGLTSIIAWWMPSPGGTRPINQANLEGESQANFGGATSIVNPNGGESTTTQSPDFAELKQKIEQLSEENKLLKQQLLGLSTNNKTNNTFLENN